MNLFCSLPVDEPIKTLSAEGAFIFAQTETGRLFKISPDGKFEEISENHDALTEQTKRD